MLKIFTLDLLLKNRRRIYLMSLCEATNRKEKGGPYLLNWIRATDGAKKIVIPRTDSSSS